MNTTTFSTETGKDLDFGKFLSQLSSKFEPLQIFCFHKKSSSQSQFSCFNPEESIHQSNYHLLLITATATRIDYEVQDFANNHYKSGSITVICHSNESVWNAIDANSRFFKTIYSNSLLVYSHDGLLNKAYVEPYLPNSAATKALKHYKHRSQLANSFLNCASVALDKGSYEICAFLIHQAIEQTCICSIRVHIAYRSEFHNLNRLLKLCQCFSHKLYDHFFATTESVRLLEIISKSYSGARYKDGFVISKEDATAVHRIATSFIDLSNVMCESKIELLSNEVNQN
jgi:HEPN domain-containing protein